MIKLGHLIIMRRVLWEEAINSRLRLALWEFAEKLEMSNESRVRDIILSMTSKRRPIK